MLVVIYHAWFEVMPGGSYGVTVFFVLSGFLITGILLEDVERLGCVDLRRFYWNRAVRLFPALFLMLFVYVVFLGEPSDVVWPMTYSTNIGYIAGASVGHLAHTWSLAVEEHFYLLWPLILPRISAERRLVTTAWLLGLATVYRVVLVIAEADARRVYFGTDTTAYAILAGCALAVAHRQRWFVIPHPRTTSLAAMGIIGAAVTLRTGTTVHLWGEFLIVFLSAIAVAGSLGVVRSLESAPLKWLGSISYGLYLWHVPLLSAQLPIPPGVRVGIAVAIAWLSLVLIEAPLKRVLRQDRGSPVPEPFAGLPS